MHLTTHPKKSPSLPLCALLLFTDQDRTVVYIEAKPSTASCWCARCPASTQTSIIMTTSAYVGDEEEVVTGLTLADVGITHTNTILSTPMVCAPGFYTVRCCLDD